MTFRRINEIDLEEFFEDDKFEEERRHSIHMEMMEEFVSNREEELKREYEEEFNKERAEEFERERQEELEQELASFYLNDYKEYPIESIPENERFYYVFNEQKKTAIKLSDELNEAFEKMKQDIFFSDIIAMMLNYKRLANPESMISAQIRKIFSSMNFLGYEPPISYEEQKLIEEFILICPSGYDLSDRMWAHVQFGKNLT